RCKGRWALASAPDATPRIKKGIPRPACTKVPENGWCPARGAVHAVTRLARRIKKGIPRPACTKAPKNWIALAYAEAVPVLLPRRQSPIFVGLRHLKEGCGAICGVTVHQRAA